MPVNNPQAGIPPFADGQAAEELNTRLSSLVIPWQDAEPGTLPQSPAALLFDARICNFTPGRESSLMLIEPSRFSNAARTCLDFSQPIITEDFSTSAKLVERRWGETSTANLLDCGRPALRHRRNPGLCSLRLLEFETQQNLQSSWSYVGDRFAEKRRGQRTDIGCVIDMIQDIERIQARGKDWPLVLLRSNQIEIS